MAKEKKIETPEHKEARLAKRRAYYAANKEKIQKRDQLSYAKRAAADPEKYLKARKEADARYQAKKLVERDGGKIVDYANFPDKDNVAREIMLEIIQEG